MRFHFLVISLIFWELAELVHQVVGYHEELQLLVLRIRNHVVAQFRQFRLLVVDKSEYPRADGFNFLNGFHHLNRTARDRGKDHY